MYVVAVLANRCWSCCHHGAAGVTNVIFVLCVMIIVAYTSAHRDGADHFRGAARKLP